MLTLGVLVGIAAGVTVSLSSDDPDPPATVATAAPSEPESPVAKAIKGDDERPAEPAEPPELTVREPTIAAAGSADPVPTIEPPVAAVEPVTQVKLRRPRIEKPETKPEPKPQVVEPVEPKPEVTDDRPRGNAEALTKKATDQYIAGNFSVAEGLYKQALGANRGYAPAHKGLGFLYQRIGNKAKAIEALRTYLKLVPNAKDADAVQKRLDLLGGA